ncbi:MAG: APC family permease [Sulfobacillus thermotolerans]|uniref:Amino acid permease/ SLC12A domain-containing protein n=1 Tax=Sulfobacillus thermotolerans TaxID=338644 RepID=A0ABM6RP73_9FIRM|nr:hypothetical protein BXT84_03300 [Sulfobacillus thermotolerans]MCY0908284.1 APC family permease [Sulfobacillus thermotolerans]
MGHGTKVVKRLQQNSLTTADITAVSMANTAPAMSFFFSFATIAAAAGIASPLAIVVAAIVILLKINSLVEFTRVTPSTGSYISYIGKTFGPVAGVMAAWALSFGFIVAVGFVIAVLGGWTSLILQQFLHVTVAWQFFSILFVLVVGYLVYRGVKISTKWAAAMFAFELLLILVSMAAIIVTHWHHLSFSSFNPHYIKNGLAGMGLAFPLAVFLFIGVGNPGAMVEETQNPRRAVPVAIYTATLLVTVIYVLMAWTTSVAFHNNAQAIASQSVPFVVAASKALGPFTLLVYLAGLTSTFASLIGATNAQARMIFSAGREGLLPFELGRVSRYGTPVSAIILYLGVALTITLIWAHHGSPLTIAGVIATLGTIPVALVYLVLNLAVPVYYLRECRSQFSWLRHLVIPIAGTLALILPLWGLIEPGQPAPFNEFPWIVLGLLMVAWAYALWRLRHIPDLADRVGSIIADE